MGFIARFTSTVASKLGFIMSDSENSDEENIQLETEEEGVPLDKLNDDANALKDGATKTPTSSVSEAGL